MKIRCRWLSVLFLLTFAILGTRWAWTLTVSKIGWRPHLDQWVETARSLVGIENTPLSDRSPPAQAAYWLDELSRVESVGDDPRIAIGAAWMLDAPQSGFIRRHLRTRDDLDLPGLPMSFRTELDFDAIDALSEEFESLCRDDGLAQIETAVGLDRDNVEVWRARALLAFKTKLLGFDMEPRRDDWRPVLDECADHDPENALYDYLAALHLWSTSAKYEWEEQGYTLTVNDRDNFEEANTRFASGLAKPYLRFGSESYASTMAYLEASSLSRADHVTAAGSGQVSKRATGLLYQIMRWQLVRSDVEQRNADVEAAAVAARNVLNIADQISEVGNIADVAGPRLILRRWALANLNELNIDEPSLLTQDEAEKLSAELSDVRLDLKVINEVGKRLAAKAGQPAQANDSSNGHPASGRQSLASSLLTSSLTVVAQTLVIVTLALSLLAGILSRVVGKGTDEQGVELGWFPHVAAWLGGTAASFLLLGMVPAEVVPPRGQTVVVGGLIWVGFAMLVLGFLHLVRRPFQLSWGQVAVLGTIASAPIFVVLRTTDVSNLLVDAVAALHPGLTILLLVALGIVCWLASRVLSAFVRHDGLSRRRKLLAGAVISLIALVCVPAGTALGNVMADEFEPRAWIPPTVWDEAESLPFTAPELQGLLHLSDSKWLWACLQWLAHDGLIAAPVTAGIVLLIWHLIRRAHLLDGGLREIIHSRKRSQMRLAGSLIAKSYLAACLFVSLIYLAAAPRVVEIADRYYQVHSERMLDPSQLWDEVETETNMVKTDHVLMRELKAEIAQQNRQIGE